MTTPLMPSRPELPEKPQRLEAADAQQVTRNRSNWMAVTFTIVALMIVLSIVSVIHVGMTFVLVGMVLLVGIHYITWGWWLGKIIIQDEANESDSD